MAPTSPRTLLRSSELEIDRVPWSILGPEFIASWGQPRGKLMPEHLEILGPTGSGKSFVLVDAVKERVRRRESSVIYVATKQADSTISELGWPVTSNWNGVRRADQVVFWPRTKRIGTARKAYQNERISDLLGHLWQKDANTVLIFDEFSYIEGLSADIRDTLNMYLREGRSHGITCVAGKQRVQGVQRDMHSETDWKLAFKMNDDDDNERLAQLFGERKLWLPVIDSLDREAHEFLIQHKLTGRQYISWVDKPLAPKARPQQTGYRKAA
jgi:hypothetical protein